MQDGRREVVSGCGGGGDCGGDCGGGGGGGGRVERFTLNTSKLKNSMAGRSLDNIPS